MKGREGAQVIQKGLEELQSIFDFAPAAISYKDNEGKYIRINRAFCEITGFREEDCIGKKASELFPQISEKYLKDDEEVLNSGTPKLGVEQTFITKNGIRHTYVNKIPYKNNNGKILGVISVSVDITGRKIMEQALRQSEEHLRLIFESVNEGITVTDLHGDIIQINEAAASMHEYSNEELIGKNAFTLIDRKDHIRAEESLKTTLTKGQNGTIRYTFLKKNGGEFSGELNAALIKDSTGKPVGFVAITRDISEREQAEKALKESERRYKVLFDNARDGIAVRDLTGNILMANHAMEALTGYSRGELLKMHVRWSSTSHEREILLLDGFVKDEELSPKRCEMLLKTKNDEIKDVELTEKLLQNSERTWVIQSILRDVTSQKQFQENIRAYAKKVWKAQEEERKRISRELHDETAQSLSSLGMDMDRSISSQMVTEDLKNKLSEYRTRVENILFGVRRLSSALRPHMLEELGLLSALEGIASLTNDSGIATRFEIKGTPRRLPSDMELALFRIVQEGLNNIIKHSCASHATLIIAFENQGINVNISDDGDGFEMPEVISDLAKAGKMGLLGMQERVALLNGKMTITTGKGKGMQITIEVEQ